MTEKKEKVKEIFEIEKNGKEEIVESQGTIEKDDKPSKEQIKKENEILRNILIVVGILVLFFVGILVGSKFLKGFSFEGERWDTIKAGQITFYHTEFPVYENGTHVANHNVYFRNDPRKLERDILFEGDFYLTKMLVVQGLDNFSCTGYGVASEDAFEQVLNAWGTDVMYDPEAECDDQGRYNLVRLEADNSTWIESLSPTCQVMHIKDCEVYQAKERYLVQQFIYLNELKKSSNSSD